MAHSYTPGLTVTEQAVVRRRRMLSLPGSVLVTTGETVRANQAVARAELPGKVYPLNLANQLGVAPDEINEYLIKKAGDPVQKDEILAENKPLIKWLKTEVLSPITGVVESVSTVTGQVLLREPPRVLELLGYVDGSIVEVIPQQGVVVETDCSLVQGIFGIGGETWGEIVIAVTSPDEALTPRHLTTAMKGKVVVGGSFISSDALARAKEVGVGLRSWRGHHGHGTGRLYHDSHRRVRRDSHGRQNIHASFRSCRTTGLDLRRHANPCRRHSTGDHHSQKCRRIGRSRRGNRSATGRHPDRRPGAHHSRPVVRQDRRSRESAVRSPEDSDRE